MSEFEVKSHMHLGADVEAQCTGRQAWKSPVITSLSISQTAGGPVDFIIEDSLFGLGGNMNPECEEAPFPPFCFLPNTS